MAQTNYLPPVFSPSEIDTLKLPVRIYGAVARIYRAACSTCSELGHALDAPSPESSAELARLSLATPYSVVLSALYSKCLNAKPKNSQAAEWLGAFRIREPQKMQASIELLNKALILADEMLAAFDGRANPRIEVEEWVDRDRTRLGALSADVIEIATHFEGAHDRDEQDKCALDDIARWLQLCGSSPSQALAGARLLISNKGGRPITIRRPAIRGLDLKIVSPHLSWTRVTQQVCECGSDTHDGCIDRLDSAVASLRKVLAKHGLDTFKFDAQGRLLV